MLPDLGLLRPTLLLIGLLVLLLGSGGLYIWLYSRLAAKRDRKDRAAEARLAGAPVASEADEKEIIAQRKAKTLGSWVAFFSSSGTIQAMAAILGMVIGGLGAVIRPAIAEPVGGRVIRLTASAETPTVRVIELRPNRSVTVAAITQAPADAAATILLFDANRETTSEVRRLSLTSRNWTIWRGMPHTSRLQLVCTRPDDASKKAATVVQVVVVEESQPVTPRTETSPAK